MRKMFVICFVALSALSAGCGKRDLPNGSPCQAGIDCLSGTCVSNKCVGRDIGQSCLSDAGVILPGMCDSGQCEGTPAVCVAQTCSPVCNYGDICLGTSTNRCAPATGSYNGEACYRGDLDCISVKCSLASNTCEGRSDGSFCTMNEQCNPGSSCLSNVCQPTGSTCPACAVGQKCVSGACVSVLLSSKDSCVKDSDCASGHCDAGPRNYWTCRAGQACSPTYPAANTVACGTPILPNNGCGTTQNGTGTLCATGVCNGTSCVNTCSPTYPAANTVACGTPILPNNGCGTTPSGTGTYCASGNCNGTSCVTGGSGLPNGSSCTAHNQCASLNCGPKFEANKTCNGTVDYNQTAAVATDCHSGKFITGTNRCGPDQFIGCATSSAYTDFQFFSSAGALTRTARVGGTGRCVVSDPTKDETVATENGDIVCTQQTFWTDASVACIIKLGGF